MMDDWISIGTTKKTENKVIPPRILLPWNEARQKLEVEFRTILGIADSEVLIDACLRVAEKYKFVTMAKSIALTQRYHILGCWLLLLKNYPLSEHEKVAVLVQWFDALIARTIHDKFRYEELKAWTEKSAGLFVQFLFEFQPDVYKPTRRWWKKKKKP